LFVHPAEQSVKDGQAKPLCAAQPSKSSRLLLILMLILHPKGRARARGREAEKAAAAFQVGATLNRSRRAGWLPCTGAVSSGRAEYWRAVNQSAAVSNHRKRQCGGRARTASACG
jgi:hypothetical protein